MAYKLVQEDEHAFTVQHHDGSHFKVAKKGLNDHMMKKIRTIEPLKMADGGEVPSVLPPEATSAPDIQSALSFDPQAPIPANVPSHDQMVQRVSDQIGQEHSVYPKEMRNQMAEAQIADNTTPGFFGRIENAVNAAQSGIAPQSPKAAGIADADTAAKNQEDLLKNYSGANESPGSSQTQNYLGMPQGYDAMAPFNQERDALKQNAAAQMQMSRDTATAIDKAQKDGDALMGQFQKNFAQYDEQRKAYEQKLQNQQVDPKRVWSNMSTGNKFLAGIGLLLSGIGSGISGQPNQAVEVMKHMMDKDMEAQKMEIGKTENLLSENLRATGSMQQAMLMTRQQQLTTLEYQLKKAAAIAGTPMAQANLNMHLAQLQMEQNTLTRQLAVTRTKAQISGLGGGQAGLPVGAEPAYTAMLPAADQKEYYDNKVRVGDRVYLANNKEAASKMNEYEPIANHVGSLLKELQEIGPAAAKNPMSEAALRAESIRDQLHTQIPLMQTAEVGGKRPAQAEANVADSVISNPGGWKELINPQTKTSQFFKSFLESAESQRKQNLRGYLGDRTRKNFRVDGN